MMLTLVASSSPGLEGDRGRRERRTSGVSKVGYERFGNWKIRMLVPGGLRTSR